ncbi:hypothetical protein C9374_005219 [Naegleria lovaniensis]|uniref:Thioredoxin domain-containing protein n=1 Tax=Naegleria lovaniensis TaxID=51637 RepID=A0AA88KIB4_NAELO|nr:uncharacterized protein C9374_005219 [Naegleria lovaniensis]KAG2382639.1 hypothetical protein C9374_005219 [Naegleria lovaniensis]
MSQKLSSFIISKKFLFVTIGVILLIYFVSWMNLRANKASSSSTHGTLEIISENELSESSTTTPQPPPSSNKPLLHNDDTNDSSNYQTPKFIYEENLKGSSIESFISESASSSPVSFIYIYAPWCGHCKAFAPTFTLLVEKIKEKFKGRVKVGRVNGPDNYESAIVKLGVRGYPTLAFFRNGEMNTKLFYEGSRNVEDIIKFIEEKMLK